MRPPEFDFNSNASKLSNLSQVKEDLVDHGFQIVEYNFDKPWGGYFTIADNKYQVNRFLRSFYPRQRREFQNLDITPKILVLSPVLDLNLPPVSTSFQYHHRRREIQKVVVGPVGIAKSKDDTYPDYYSTLIKSDISRIDLMERHKIIGSRNYGLVAELWIHTDPNNRSNEDDIVKIS